MKTYRIHALITSLVFLALALALASKYYHGPHHVFADAYLGDVFIVGCLYFWLALIKPRWYPRLKGGIILLVALTVESFQATGIPASWGLPEPFVFVLGSQFDIRDLAFYLLGITLALLIDRYLMQKHLKKS